MIKADFADGRYVTLEIIGSGGMALVVKVFDQNLNLERAIKLLPTARQHSQEARLRHEREAQLAAQLEHPHVVPIHDFFEDEDQLCTVMSLAKGNVVDWVQMHGLVEPRLALEEMLGVLDALGKAHALGIIHRDIKPHNILISEDGRLQLADFGIAQFKNPAADLTHTGALLGSPAFMAPEQRKDSANVDARCDLFAFAGTLIWMLCYKTPLDLQIDPNESLELDEVPFALQAILTKATAAKCEDRYQSAKELREALLSSLDELPKSKRNFADFTKVGSFGIFNTLPPPVQQAPFNTHSISEEIQRPTSKPVGLYTLILLLFLVIAWLGLRPVPQAPLKSNTSAPKKETRYAYDLPICKDAIEFSTRPLRKLGGRETLGSTMVDIDQDGHLDALFVQQIDQTANIYWGNESGQLEEPQTIKIERTGVVPAVGDINQDGRQDLIFTSADKSKISIFLGAKARSFEPLSPLFQDQRPVDPVLVHLNDDSNLDLAFLGEEGLSWRAGDGNSGFGEHQLLTSPVAAFVFSTEKPARRLFTVSNKQLSVFTLRGQLFAETPKVLAKLPTPETAASPYDRYQIRVQSSQGKAEILVWEYPRAEWIIKYREAENWAGCLFARFERQRIGGLGDWSKDGISDLISHRTCSYCTSNQEIRFGRPISGVTP